MTSTRRSRKALLGLAAFASVAAILPFTNTAQALPAGTPAAGVAVLTPGSGTNANNFSISLPADPLGGGAKCPGDGINGYRFGTYITPITNDPATLTFDGSGSPIGPALTSSIRNPAGTFVRGLTPGAGDGLIALPAAGLSWVGLTPPAGAYNVGIACTLNDGAATPTINNTKFWNAQITVTSTGATTFSYVTGVFLPPAPPVLTTDTYNAGTTTATVNFTHATSSPATTGYTATVTQVSGAAAPIGPISVAAGATSFQIPGVALGSSYNVTLVATNSVGNSGASNTVLVEGATAGTAPVPTAPNPFVDSAFTVTWTAAAPAPASYDVAITGAGIPVGYVSSFTGVTGLSQGFAAGLPAGSYSVTVTPVYAAGSGVTGTPGVSAFSVVPGALIFQELTVTRPAGALILTQRCGVNNFLPSVSAGDVATVPNDFPGFPFNLDQGGNIGRIGTAPILVDSNNVPIDGNATLPGVQTVTDPEFANYPLPNDNPALGTDVPFGNVTQCGLNMGVARFVTEFNSPVPGGVDNFVSPLAGEFFAANGRLNEVTVLDTRDLDAGWKLRGDIESRFTSIANGDSFSGDYLGWIPQMTDDSDVVGGEAPNGVGTTLYDQTVKVGPQTGSPEATGARATAGVPDGRVLPGDGFPADTRFPNIGAIGMTDNPVLASAPAGSGLGIATIDARLLLLIPASVDAADYAATLTLTVS